MQVLSSCSWKAFIGIQSRSTSRSVSHGIVSRRQLRRAKNLERSAVNRRAGRQPPFAALSLTDPGSTMQAYAVLAGFGTILWCACLLAACRRNAMYDLRSELIVSPALNRRGLHLNMDNSPRASHSIKAQLRSGDAGDKKSTRR